MRNNGFYYYVVACIVLCFTEMVTCTWHAEDLQKGCAVGAANYAAHCK